MDNHTEIIPEAINNGNEYLPLDAFYEELRNNDFTVTSYQIINANKIIIQYANYVKSEAELCNYLIPLFATSAEEQVLFREIYNRHFKPRQPIYTSWRNSTTDNIKKNWKIYTAGYAIFALAVIIFLVNLSYRYSNQSLASSFFEKDPTNIKYSLSTTLNAATNSTDLQAKMNKPVQVFVTAHYKFIQKLTLANLQYNWGDSTATDSISSHIYHTPGKYEITVLADITDEGFHLEKQIIHGTISVCSEDNYLRLQQPLKDTLKKGEKAKLIAMVPATNKPNAIEWFVDGSFYARDRKDLSISFSTIGDHIVTCIAIYDSVNSPCTLRQSHDFFVPDTSKHINATNINQGTSTSKKDRTIAPFLYSLWRTSLVLFLLLTIYFLFLSEKAKKKTADLRNAAQKRFQKLTDILAGEKVPQILPFKNKNYLPAQLAGIISLSKQMRQRINDNITYLHVDKTIQRSIENNGLFSPVNIARTRQTEFLVLIDETNPNDQLVKLFDYLVFMFKKQNVLIETFYYNFNPAFCYNNNESTPIPLEKLNKRYNNHILLILGDANKFINDELIFNNGCLELIQLWQYKAIVTPVSFTDWTNKEKKILLPHIPIFPADLEGLNLFMEFLSNKEKGMDLITRLNQMKGLFYPVKEINFDDIDELIDYCDTAQWAIIHIRERPVNILFEWIAGLSIYPNIRWEISLAIGKAIFSKYGKARELNYSALLHLTRISWMKEGAFPYHIRVQLLQKLSAENEMIARETLLELLNEIPATDIIPNSTAHEEKEIQQIINEFRLNAHDPLFHSVYKESEEVFKMLWKADMIKDKAIIEKFKTDNATWKVFDDQLHHKNSDRNIETYFELVAKEDTLLSRIYLWLGLISIFVTVSSYFALLVLDVWGKAN